MDILFRNRYFRRETSYNTWDTDKHRKLWNHPKQRLYFLQYFVKKGFHPQPYMKTYDIYHLRFCKKIINKPEMLLYMKRHHIYFWFSRKYMDKLHGYLRANIINVRLHKVHLQIEWNEFRDINNYYFTWETVVFPYKKLYMYSNYTGNDDERSHGCGLSRYHFTEKDFRWEVETPHGITFRHFVEAIFRLKGSKKDYHYELYLGFKVCKIDTKNDKISIEIYFDYGS